MPKKKTNKNPFVITRTDLDRKQGSINFTTTEITSESLGNGDFKFTSLTKSQLAPSDPSEDEGRLYIKDKSGALYFITATKVG